MANSSSGGGTSARRKASTSSHGAASSSSDSLIQRSSEHRVDQRVEKIPAFGMAQEGELLVGADQIGDQGGEAGDRQGEQPKDRLVAKPEGDRIDDQEEERRALAGSAPRLGHRRQVVDRRALPSVVERSDRRNR